jgi:hypothetical protein
MGMELVDFLELWQLLVKPRILFWAEIVWLKSGSGREDATDSGDQPLEFDFHKSTIAVESGLCFRNSATLPISPCIRL